MSFILWDIICAENMVVCDWSVLRPNIGYIMICTTKTRQACHGRGTCKQAHQSGVARVSAHQSGVARVNARTSVPCDFLF